MNPGSAQAPDTARTDKCEELNSNIDLQKHVADGFHEVHFFRFENSINLVS